MAVSLYNQFKYWYRIPYDKVDVAIADLVIYGVHLTRSGYKWIHLEI